MPNPLGLPDEVVQKRPSSLRDLLSLQPVPLRVVELDRRWGPLAGQRLGIKGLAAQDLMEASAAAVRWCEEVNKIEARHLYSDLGEGNLQVETQVQILSRALVSPEASGERLVDGPDDVRSLFSPEQVSWLFERFSEWQAERSPYDVVLDPERIEQIADELGKGYRPTTWLSSCDAGTVKRISAALVARLLRQTSQPSSASG